jgi:outer membrane receptor protein involved in Fe transport
LILNEISIVFIEYQVELNERISIKPSLRLEYVDKEITFSKSIVDSTGNPESAYPQLLSITPDLSTSIQELNYFPNFNLTYNFENKKSIQFGISKRIERPGGGWGNQLRPFPRSVYNESFIMIGNANLKPEFSTQYEISYRSPMPMGFYSANIYYRDVKDPIEWYSDNENVSDNGTIVSFRNADGLKDYGMDLFFMVMGQTIGGGYNINELKDASGDFQLNGKNEDLNIFMRINLPEKFIKFFSYEFGFYYMQRKMPGGTMFGNKGTLWANTGISKSFLDSRLDLSFSVNNIFDMGGFQMDYLEPIDDNLSRKTQIEVSRGGRAFSLSLKYNFGKMQEEKRRGSRGEGSGGGMDMGY